MECHKCEHRAAIAAGKFRGVPFEQTPCAKCSPDTGPTYPMEFNEKFSPEGVASDAPSVPETAFPEEALPEPEPPVALSMLYPVGAFLDVVMALFALSDTDLAVLRLKYRQLSHEQVAVRLGLTERAVEGRFMRVLLRYPVLSALFPCRRAGGAVIRPENGNKSAFSGSKTGGS